MPAVLALLAQADPDNILLEIDAGICILEGYDITMEDIEIRYVEKDGFAASTISDDDVGDVSLVLDMSLDDELMSKGLSRDIIRRVQAKRKELDLDMEANIELTVWMANDAPEISQNDWSHLINETRASTAELSHESPPKGVDSFTVDDVEIHFSVS